MQFGLIELIIYVSICTIIMTAIMTALVVKMIKTKDNTRAKLINKTQNKLPEQLPKLKIEESAIVSIYQTEWKTIIETQMHFNDLIIRFRAIVLTVFVTVIGASVALLSKDQTDETLFTKFLFIILVFWITAFILDRFYYHRLLLGSVAQAMKFDQSALGKQYGLFGLTTCIAESVHPPASSKLIYLFYGLPATVLIIVLILHLI